MFANSKFWPAYVIVTLKFFRCRRLVLATKTTSHENTPFGGRAPAHSPTTNRAPTAATSMGVVNPLSLLSLVRKPRLTGDRECAAFLETPPLQVSCSPAASPFRTSAITTLWLPLSGFQDRGCRTPAMQPPSGLRWWCLLTRAPRPLQPCPGLPCPRAPSTLCRGSSVLALRKG